eukprot:gene7101-11264_t
MEDEVDAIDFFALQKKMKEEMKAQKKLKPKKIEEISSLKLYNIFQYQTEKLRILDLRKEQKIAFPHSNPIISYKEDLETLIMVLIDVDDEYIVVVCDDIKEDSFEKKVITLASKKQSKAKKIFFFCQGVEEFTLKYPFLYGEFIPHPNEIIEDLLFISGVFSGNELEHVNNLKIDYLINLSGIECKLSDKLNYFEFKKITKENVEKIFSLIDEAKEKKKKILIYGPTGNDISATVSCGYLISKLNMDSQVAMKLIKEMRPTIKFEQKIESFLNLLK